jgi:hypothetical protein
VLGSLPRVAQVAISPDRAWVAGAAIHFPRVRVWNAADGRVLCNLADQTHAAFSSDGRWFATGSKRAVHLYRAGSWSAPEHVFERDEVCSWWNAPLAFQPGGRLLAFSPARGYLRLGDCETGRIAANLVQPESLEVTWLAFSPDGTRLAVASDGINLAVWDLACLRADMEELGLDAEDFPRRSAPSSSGQAPFVVQRGPELPPPRQWSKCWLLMAGKELRKGNYADAVHAATQALHLLPPGTTAAEHAEVFILRGRYHLLAGSLSAARDDWQQAQVLAPNLPEAARGLARLALLGPAEYRDPERAFALLAPLVNREPAAGQDRLLCALAQVRLGHPEKALALLNDLKDGSLSPLAGYTRALGQHQLGRQREAAAALVGANAARARCLPSLAAPERDEVERLRGEVEALLGRK